MRKALFVYKTEQMQTLLQTKLLLVLFFLVAVYESTLSPLMELCQQTGLEIHMLEPFILICSNRLNIIAVPLIYITIVSNFPYCRTNYFGLIRLQKKDWLRGELLFVAISAFLLVFAVFCGSILFLAGRVKLSGDWGSFMRYFGVDYTQLYLENSELLLEASVITHGKPPYIAVYVAAAMWMYLTILGLLLLYGTIAGKKNVMTLISIVITLVSGGILYFDTQIRWFFPLTHILFGAHFNSLFAKVRFPLYGSFIYLILIFFVLLVITIRKLKVMVVGE